MRLRDLLGATMTNACPGICRHKLNRDSLHDFIAGLPENAEFSIQNWLETLELSQLKNIEDDTTKYCTNPAALGKVTLADLADIATTAFFAERRLDIDLDEASCCIDTLMIGLAVAACIERLKRAGWVVLNGKIGIVLEEPRPYRITQLGVEEGVWSAEPMTLWILGSSLQLH